MHENRTSFEQLFPSPQPDRLQQVLNRLLKRYENIPFEDRRLRIADEIDEMQLSDPDRRELLRRLE